MKFKVTDKILDYDGQAIKETEDQDLNWKRVIHTALNNSTRDEVLTAEIKEKCYQITTKVYKTNEPDLTVSEIAFVLERIGKIYTSPLIIGRSEEYFNKKTPEEEAKV